LKAEIERMKNEIEEIKRLDEERYGFDDYL